METECSSRGTIPAIEWIDGHLDLAYLAVRGRDLEQPMPAGDGGGGNGGNSGDDPIPDGCVTLPALRAANVTLALGTVYTAPGHDSPYGYTDSRDFDGAEQRGLEQIRVYEHLEERGAISIARGHDDIETAVVAPATATNTRASARPGPAIILLMEGADPIRDHTHVRAWHERGLRFVGLTWVRGTRYAGGNGSGGPLTARGVDLIAALDDAGIVHDASHLSDEAFDGLVAHARGPIVATHSNCRALLPGNQRHLRDDQIREIAQRDGVVGLNLYTEFLARGRRATVDDCVAHVEHVATTMGHRRGVALGSDMDGGFGRGDLPEGVDHPMRLTALADGLRHAGWSDDDVAGFAHGNWSRFLRRTMPA